jgi:hypothetical protein
MEQGQELISNADARPLLHLKTGSLKSSLITRHGDVP